MRIGITYDTGFTPGHRTSRPLFEPDQIAFDMQAIARDLHCNAVRITGGNIERLSIAAESALAAGLDVWFSPFPAELDVDQTLSFFDDCAVRAEELRQRSDRRVLLVLGCEASLFCSGFLPGANVYERMIALASPTQELMSEYPATVAKLNSFLENAAERSRARFSGPITYAAGLWEDIDWAVFDLVGVDAYRDQGNKTMIDDQLEALTAFGKPVVVTEFGCCTYRGAALKGATGWNIVEGTGANSRIATSVIRDEQEQVDYLHQMMDTYQRHGIEEVFWFTFASWNRPHRENPQDDLDVASFGAVKLCDNEDHSIAKRWKPKAVFHAIADLPR